MRNKDEATPNGFGVDAGRRLTPLEVQEKEFRISFRGYNERDVDEFLDRVTEELQRFEAELMRVRSGQAAFDPSSLDMDAEGRRVLREAREQADVILREAEARAAGIPTASAADARAVVAPYLNREREFLQSLGSLVQDHAQTIKTMVEEARRRTEQAPAPALATTLPPAGAELGDDEPAHEPDEIVVLGSDQRVPSGPERGGEDDPQPEGARSLRELFWGED